MHRNREDYTCYSKIRSTLGGVIQGAGCGYEERSRVVGARTRTDVSWGALLTETAYDVIRTTGLGIDNVTVVVYSRRVHQDLPPSCHNISCNGPTRIQSGSQHRMDDFILIFS